MICDLILNRRLIQYWKRRLFSGAGGHSNMRTSLGVTVMVASGRRGPLPRTGAVAYCFVRAIWAKVLVYEKTSYSFGRKWFDEF